MTKLNKYEFRAVAWIMAIAIAVVASAVYAGPAIQSPRLVPITSVGTVTGYPSEAGYEDAECRFEGLTCEQGQALLESQ